MLRMKWMRIVNALISRAFEPSRRPQSRHHSELRLAAIVEPLEPKSLLSATPIALDTTINGTITPGNSVQSYQFLLTKEQLIHINQISVSTSGDPSNEVDNVQWNLIFADGSGSEISANTEMNLQPGLYTLIAGGTGPSSSLTSYSFSVATDSTLPTAIATDSVVNGSLDHYNQQNTYTLDLAQSAHLWFDSQKSDYGLTWSLVVNNRRTGNTFDDPSNSDWGVVPAGSYTLTVSSTNSYGHIGAYSFEILNLHDATPISVESPFSGALNPANGVQAYQFSGTAGQTLTIANTSFSQSNGATFQGANWKLYSPYENEIYSNSFKDDTFRITLPDSGTYTLLVNGMAANTGSISYAISVKNSVDTNAALALNSSVSSSLAIPGQIQNYNFDLTAPAQLWFDGQSDTSNLNWVLTSPTGSLSKPIAHGLFSAGDQNLGFLPAGHYTLSVSGLTTQQSYADGRPKIQLGNFTGTYSFNLFNLANAPTFVLGTTVSSTLSPANSMRVHQFSGTAGQALYFANAAFSSTDTSAANGAATWALYDQAGTQIFATNLRSDGGRIVLSHSGNYFLIVSGATGNNGTTTYSFNVDPTGDSTSAISLNTPISGSLTHAGQQVQYTVTLADLTKLWFDSQSSTPNLQWQLSWPNGNVPFVPAGQNFQQQTLSLFSSDDQVSGVLHGGTYTLTVSGIGNAVGSYAFNLLDIGAATPMTIGNSSTHTGPTITGTLSVPSQTNLYAFTTPEYAYYYLHNLTLTPNASVSWQLLTQYGWSYSRQPITTDDNFLQNTGGYILAVSGALSNTVSANYTFQGNFQFSLGPTAPVVPVTSTPISLGTTYTAGSGVISSGNYGFTLTEATDVWFDATNNNAVNWGITGTNFSFGSSYTLMGTTHVGLMAPGNYVLNISSNQPILPNAFTFRLVNNSTASPITIGTSVTPTQPPAANLQLYQFTTTSPQIISVHNLTLGQMDSSLKVFLYDSYGSSVPFGGNSSQSTFALKAVGIYTLAIVGTSKTSFVVQPTVTTIPLSLNTPKSGSLTSPSQIDSYTFTLSAPSTVNLNLVAPSNVTWSISGPTGTIVSSSTSQFHLGGIELLAAGTYTLSVTDLLLSAPVNYSLNLMKATNQTVMTAGTPVTGTLSPTTATRFYSFTALSSQSLSISSSTVSTTGTVGTGSWILYDPSGIQIASNSIASSLSNLALQSTGLYSLVVFGAPGDTGTITFSMNIGLRSLITPIPLQLNSQVAGVINSTSQLDAYTFTLTVPTHLYFDNVSSNGSVSWSMNNADGSLFQNAFGYAWSSFYGQDVDLGIVPAGQYQLATYMYPNAATFGISPPQSYAFNLLSFANATPVSMGTTVTTATHPSTSTQLYQISVSGDQAIELQSQILSSTDTSAAHGQAQWTLYDADGVIYGTTDWTNRLDQYSTDGTARYDVHPGVYTLMVSGDAAETGNTSYSFSLLPFLDRQFPLPFNDIVTASNSTSGQRQEYTFTLTAPTDLWFDSQTSITSSPNVFYGIRNENGDLFSYLQNTDNSELSPFGSGDFHLGTLPAGRYTFYETGEGTYSFQLLNLALATAITPGTPINVALSPANSTQIFRFTGTANEAVFLGSSGFSTTDSSGQNGVTYWSLINSRGQLIDSGNLETGASRVSLPTTDTYYVVIEGGIANDGSTTFALGVTPITDQSRALTLNSTVSGSIVAPGQKQSYTFSVTTTSPLIFDSETNDAKLSWQLTNSSGNVTNSGGTPTQFNNDDVFLKHLVPGSYTLTVSGAGAYTGSFAFKLLSLLSASAISTGTASSTTGPTVAGTLNPANGVNLYALSAVAGSQLLFDNISISANSNANWQLIDPYGTSVFNSSLGADQASVKMYFNGTYTLVISAPVATTAATAYSFQINYQTPATPTPFTGIPLTLGTTYTNATNPIGGSYEVDYAFSLSSATSLFLYGFSDSTTTWKLIGPQGAITLSDWSTLSQQTYPYNNGPYVQNKRLGVLPAGYYQIQVHGAIGGQYRLAMLDLASATRYTPGTYASGSSSSDGFALYQISATAGQVFDVSSYGVLNSIPVADQYGAIAGFLPNYYGWPFYQVQLIIPETGIYTFALGSSSGYSFNLAPEVHNTIPLVLDTPVSGSITSGQYDDYTFTLTQRQSLFFDSLTSNSRLNWVLKDSTGLSIDGGSANDLQSDLAIRALSPGDYTLSVYGTNGSTGDYSFKLLTIPSQPRVVASALSHAFTGNPTAVTANVIDRYSGLNVPGTITYAYFNGPTVDGTGTTTSPTNVGTYTVVATFTSSNANYGNASSAPVTFTITKALPAVVVTNSGGTFNGNPFPATVKATGIGGAAVSGSTSFMYYVGTSVSGIGTTTAPTNAGTYTVVATFTSSNANYGNASSAPVTFTITKALPIVVVTNAGGTFNGNPFPATVKATGIGGVVVSGSPT
ncbi:hypothetical protein, partial [Schlesneria paludicola]|uniref:hypothetical protein n=1 Tax=Schlesneria paludicola TaxID=360056 RepID=UPI00029AB278